MEIPKQLQRNEFRFVKIVDGTKRPVGDDWVTSNNFKYSEKEFKEHVKTAQAIGVLGGYGKLAVVDADCEEVAKEVMFKLPKTFTVKTGSGKWHFYYIVPDLKKTIKMIKDKVHYGEVQFMGAQALAPGSKHPNGNFYEVLHDEEIAEINKEKLETVLSKFYQEKPKFQHNDGFDLDISIIASKISGLDKHGEYGLQGSHPVHGSDGGMNFRIDIDKNTWHCFRCSTGGDALSLIGVLEGIITCEDCKPGYFKENPGKFKKILSAAEKYGYEGIKPRDGLVCVFRDKIKKGDLNVQGIVEYIKSMCEFIVVRDNTNRQPHIYVYQDGCYVLTGEEIIDAYIKGIFANIPWKKHYRDEILAYIRTENIVDRDSIQPPKHLINLNNGVFNIKTRELLPHDPKYYFLYKIPRDYNPKAKCPNVLKYLNSTLKKEYVALTQEIFGYCLYFDYNIPGIFYLYGTGGNGKSIWLHLLENLIGAVNVSNKSVDSLVRYRFTSSLLYGKLVNTCGELSASVLKETDMLKRLSSGEQIQAEFKGKDGFDFPNRAKIITACNAIPACMDMTDGWYQRQYIIPFLKKFRDTGAEDIYLLEKLVTNEEMEGLLYWSLQGLFRLLKNHKFSYPYNKEERYLMYQQNITYFVEHNYVKGQFDDYIHVKDILKDYYAWCKKSHVPIDSANALGRVLSKEGYTLDKLVEKNNWSYIRRYIRKC